MAPSYLGPWVDPTLEPPGDLTAEIIVVQEAARIGRALAIVLYASTIPRRLGGEATDEELVLETQRCRRVGHSLSQALKTWDENPKLPPTKEVKVPAAQLDWPQFRGDHLAELNSRLKLAATWAYRERQEHWGKRAVVRYLNEQKWLTHALRE